MKPHNIPVIQYYSQGADGCSEAGHGYRVTSLTKADCEPNSGCHILTIIQQCFGDSISSSWLVNTGQSDCMNKAAILTKDFCSFSSFGYQK